MKSESQLIVPKSKLQPPPKKSEVIDALTKLRVDKLVKESVDGLKRRTELGEELRQSVLDYVLQNITSLSMKTDLGRYYRSDTSVEGVDVTISLPSKQLPKELHAKLKEYHRLPTHAIDGDAYFTKTIRKEIAATVNGIIPHDERVTALLADDDSRKSLEKMLEALS